MKILRICTTNSQIESFCENLAELKYLDYFLLLYKNYLLYPNKFKSSMESLGYECSEVIVDFKLLQKKWCQENGYDFSENNWLISSLSHQIIEYRPEIIYLERAAFNIITNEFIKNIKRQFSFVKIITGFWGAQISNDNIFKIFSGIDFIFCIDDHLKRQFLEKKIKSFVIAHSWDSYEISNKIKENKVVFLGSTGYGFKDHENRYHDLLYLLQHLDMKIWGFEPTYSRSNLLIKKIIRFIFTHFEASVFKFLKTNIHILSKSVSKYIELAEKNQFKDLSYWYIKKKALQDLFPKKVLEPEFGIKYLKILSESEMVFNRHVDQVAHSGNMRCFEVTGVGSCLVTDRFNEMKHLFNDQEIVGYSSIEEAKEKMGYLKNNLKIAKRIAKNGQIRTLKEHTTWHRCVIIDRELKKYFNLK